MKKIAFIMQHSNGSFDVFEYVKGCGALPITTALFTKRETAEYYARAIGLTLVSREEARANPRLLNCHKKAA